MLSRILHIGLDIFVGPVNLSVYYIFVMHIYKQVQPLFTVI